MQLVFSHSTCAHFYSLRCTLSMDIGVWLCFGGPFHVQQTWNISFRTSLFSVVICFSTFFVCICLCATVLRCCSTFLVDSCRVVYFAFRKLTVAVLGALISLTHSLLKFTNKYFLLLLVFLCSVNKPNGVCFSLASRLFMWRVGFFFCVAAKVNILFLKG